MDTSLRIERALAVAIARTEVEGAPPKLAAGLRYAVFPGGARMRPRLCLEVARACSEDSPALSDAAALQASLAGKLGDRLSDASFGGLLNPAAGRRPDVSTLVYARAVQAKSPSVATNKPSRTHVDARPPV